MFQSGHRRYDQLSLNLWDDKNENEDSYAEDCYKYVIKAKSYQTIKPILDAEPSYEGIVQGLHDPKKPIGSHGKKPYPLQVGQNYNI